MCLFKNKLKGPLRVSVLIDILLTTYMTACFWIFKKNVPSSEFSPKTLQRDYAWFSSGWSEIEKSKCRVASMWNDTKMNNLFSINVRLVNLLDHCCFIRILFKEYDPWRCIFGWSETSLDWTVSRFIPFFPFFIACCIFFINCRVLWLLAISISLIVCINSIISVWSKWQNDPVLLTFDSKSMSIDQIPFPSIAICPSNRFAVNKFNFTAVYRSILKLDGKYAPDPTADQ